MEIEHCSFPDDIRIDVEKDVWIRISEDGIAKLGITSILSTLAGKIEHFRPKDELEDVLQGQVVATVESVRYFGAIRSPVRGRVSRFNPRLSGEGLKLLNNSCYDDGWVAELSHLDKEQLKSLPLPREAQDRIRSRIKELRVRCFKAIADEEMNSVGLECAATLVNLNDLLSKSPDETVVHIVSDDPFSDIEMIRWSEQTGNELLETRKEGNLFHLLVRKKEKSRTS